jgi:dihydroneopterin aldolase
MCHIGVTDEERREPQRIEVDVELHVGLEEAGRSGDLHETIDYQDVCLAVREMLESNRFHLIETAAGRLLDALLERYPASRSVVRVRKFVLPRVAHVEVQMERQRSR